MQMVGHQDVQTESSGLNMHFIYIWPLEKTTKKREKNLKRNHLFNHIKRNDVTKPIFTVSTVHLSLLAAWSSSRTYTAGWALQRGREIQKQQFRHYVCAGKSVGRGAIHGQRWPWGSHSQPTQQWAAQRAPARIGLIKNENGLFCPEYQQCGAPTPPAFPQLQTSTRTTHRKTYGKTLWVLTELLTPWEP